jgi:hypothetical protein
MSLIQVQRNRRHIYLHEAVMGNVALGRYTVYRDVVIAIPSDPSSWHSDRAELE